MDRGRNFASFGSRRVTNYRTIRDKTRRCEEIDFTEIGSHQFKSMNGFHFEKTPTWIVNYSPKLDVTDFKIDEQMKNRGDK